MRFETGSHIRLMAELQLGAKKHTILLLPDDILFIINMLPTYDLAFLYHKYS